MHYLLLNKEYIFKACAIIGRLQPQVGVVTNILGFQYVHYTKMTECGFYDNQPPYGST